MTTYALLVLFFSRRTLPYFIFYTVLAQLLVLSMIQLRLLSHPVEKKKGAILVQRLIRPDLLLRPKIIETDSPAQLRPNKTSAHP